MQGNRENFTRVVARTANKILDDTTYVKMIRKKQKKDVKKNM